MALSNVLLLRGFNNYHKRTIIKYSTLDDYESNSASYLNFASINFNPNDEVMTELIVGNDSQKENNAVLSFDTIGCPDYLVVYQTVNSVSTITSRWFILEAVKTTQGQFRLALKRDVIADHLDWLLNADCFIEKGQIMDENSPFIFNNEAMTYNQIKKKEIPMYDSTGVPWLVGYIAKNYDSIANVSGAITNTTDVDYIDMEDTPWGNLTSTQISEGITFRTVESISLFPIVCVNKYLNPSQELQTFSNCFMSRCSLSINQGEYSAYNNFGLFYRVVNPIDTSSALLELQGPGLGFFSEAWTNLGAIQRLSPAFPFTGPSSIFNVCYTSMPNSKLSSAQDIANTFINELGNGTLTQLVTELSVNSGEDFSGPAYIQSFHGKQVRVEVSPGVYKFYTVQVGGTVNNIGANWYNYLTATIKSTLINKLLSTVKKLDGTQNWTTGSSSMDVRPIYGDITIYFRECPATLTVDVTIPNISNRWGCNDQLFDMFCIPFGEMIITDDITSGGTPTDIRTRADAALAAARAMAVSLGSNLYDLQILPYCPIKEIRNAYTQSSDCTVVENIDGDDTLVEVEPYVTTSGTYEIDSDNTGMYGSYYRITDHNTNDVLNYVFWATESHGTFDVNILSTLNKYFQYNTQVDNEIVKKKISNETEIFRISSPNYNGLFEYSAAKNNDVVIYKEVTKLGETYTCPDLIQYNVDYTYRPGNPYIHLNPIFRGEDQGAIYGKDWNDVRGLICGGDFSMGYIVDAFRSYQIQNANFQNIFDRQIQNLDISNALAKEQTQYASIMSALGLPVAGATTGALAGAKAGGAYGAVAGAVVGGVGGIAGGVAGYTLNMDWLERQQQETRSYAVDMYNYGLGNIKALPYSISRTDCLAENTRLVPFLEVYESTEREVENLLNVMKYNGMTVMTIDKPRNFIGPVSSDTFAQLAVPAHDLYCYYIKAKLIMNTETPLEDDFHIMDAIYAELDKGVYIQGYEEEE